MRMRLLVAGIGLVILLVSAGPAAADVTYTPYSGDQTVSADLSDADVAADQQGVEVQSGLVTFTGNNSYSGGTIISGGTFEAKSGTALGTGDVEVQTGGTLAFNHAGTSGATFSNNISLASGSTLKDYGGGWNSATQTTLSGNIDLGGAVDVIIGGGGQTYARLVVNGTIADAAGQTGSLNVTGGISPSYASKHEAMRLYGDNSFSGGMTLNDLGWVALYHNNAAGTGAITINDGGILINQGVDVGNDVTINSGGKLRGNADESRFNGTITLGGDALIDTTAIKDDIRLNQTGGKITGSGNLTLDGNYWNGTPTFHVYGDNDYTGTTTIETRTNVKVYHENAFGTTVGNIYVNGASGGYGSSLILNANLNSNKTILVNDYGSVAFGEGVTVTTPIELTSGTINFAADGSGDRRYAGTMTLNGTVQLNQYYANNGNWIQGLDASNNPSGKITGSGKLVFGGSFAYTASVHLHGDNDYYGGTDVYRGGYGAHGLLHIYSDTALGAGLINLFSNDPAYENTYTIVLENDITLANDVYGVGKIGGSYTLTATGTWYPGHSAGEIKVDSLDFQGGYWWEFGYFQTGPEPTYEFGTDLISATDLVFGDDAIVALVWIDEEGGHALELGDYVLFSYTGDDPDLTNLSFWSPDGTSAVAWNDTVNKNVMVTIAAGAVPEPATLALLSLGGLAMAGAAVRKRRRPRA